jgi:surfeit locus 1 family protein
MPGFRKRLLQALTGFAAIAVLVILVALGIWQIQRLAWKTDLIARVDARLAAPAVAAPGPQGWPAISAARDEYRRITLDGHYLPGKDVLVKAVSVQGSGFWVMTPIQTDAGWIALVNRGFVPGARRADYPSPAAGRQQVSGLLRISQPGGAFLRSNDPDGGRWYSRDTEAIARKQSLGEVAPWFLDADAAADPDSLPAGGLTVVQFRNSHLSYALTWFGLAILWAGMLTYRLRLKRPRSA